MKIIEKITESVFFKTLIEKINDLIGNSNECKIALDSYNEQLGNLADATPLPANSVLDMTDTTKLYVNISDGYIYRHDGSSFVSTGILYQASQIEYAQETGDSENIAMSQKATTDILEELNDTLSKEYMHEAGYVYQENTEGLTDADAYPDNTIYTINASANVVNIPENFGTLITFGSTNPNTGSTQLFSGQYYFWFRSKIAKVWSSWQRMAQHERIGFEISSNNNTVVGMKVGKYFDAPTEAPEAPYNDANTFPPNQIHRFNSVPASVIANLPSTDGTMITFNYGNNASEGVVQLFITRYGVIYHRIKWASKWTSWAQAVRTTDLNSKVAECKTYTDIQLSKYIGSYTSLSLFEKFGVIGDSYASGAIYNTNGVPIGTFYNISWGQILARKLGTTCVNFSKGGIHTRSWLTDDKGLPLLLSTEPQNIYYLMLGINDKAQLGVDYIGTIDDIKADFTQNADTFYGNYGRIISNIQNHAPNAKIIMSTMIGTTGTNKTFNDAIESIAEHFGVPCIKQYESDFFNSNFYRNNIIGDHPTAPVYAGMANALQKMFEQAIIDNLDYFNDYTPVQIN